MCVLCCHGCEPVKNCTQEVNRLYNGFRDQFQRAALAGEQRHNGGEEKIQISGSRCATMIQTVRSRDPYNTPFKPGAKEKTSNKCIFPQPIMKREREKER